MMHIEKVHVTWYVHFLLRPLEIILVIIANSVINLLASQIFIFYADSAILVLAGSMMFLVLQIIIAAILIVIGIRIYCSAKRTKNTTLAVIAEHVALPFSNNVPYENVEQRSIPIMMEHVVLSSSDNVQYEDVIPVQQRNIPVIENVAYDTARNISTMENAAYETFRNVDC